MMFQSETQLNSITVGPFIVIQEECPLKNWKVHKIINLQIHHKQEYIFHSSLVCRNLAPKRMFGSCGGMWEVWDNITFSFEESRLHDMDHKRYYSNCKMWNVFTFFLFVLWKWFNAPLSKIATRPKSKCFSIEHLNGVHSPFQ